MPKPHTLPHTFLLQILVSVKAGGIFSHSILSYLDDTIKADPLTVNVGDEVGFLVQVVGPNVWQTPSYTLEFSDSSFFGVSTLSVPAGGTSSFLRVLSLQGKITYTVLVTGLGKVVDPEIQSGGGGPLDRFDAVPNTFLFTWDVAGRTLTYTQNEVVVPFSTQVVPGDTVDFEVINAGGAAQDFTVVFLTNAVKPTHWASPFVQGQPSFVADQ